ncbi:hypothetical protein N7478_011636 [Penicillium angulare]|uniref:uncharacterized protein n=1 Tax=Penicillium angulare TaxID=116970 RepID=UPI00253FFB2D|nr:uncharacterized protein N7478_011636 [Penicillium angulare]KAJ5261041.1 hypothetical protein N7478_011636 [Penicillium angulare]
MSDAESSGCLFHALTSMKTAPRRCLRCIQLSLQSQQSRSSQSSSSSSSVRRSSSREVLPYDHGDRSNAQYILIPFDEDVTPSLVAKAACVPQTQLYINFVLAVFPCYFKATETRVPINWVEYVESRQGGADTPFDWAIRSLTTIYMGSLHKDHRYLDAGRELYIRGLRGLTSRLNNPTVAKSDETLSAAIALAVFEMLACTSEDGWIHHAKGIRALMRLRGPDAHSSGFGAALYIAYRNIIVTSALVAGEDCFLEETEWQALNEKIAAENAKQPNSSVHTDITERAFREVVKLPGLVRRVSKLEQPRPSGRANVRRRKRNRPSVLVDVLTIRAALRGIFTEFSMAVSTLRSGQDSTSTAGFIGPIPHHFFDGFSRLSIQGIRSAILLLNYLVIILDPSQQSDAEVENGVMEGQMRETNDLGVGIVPTISPTSSSPSILDPDSPGRPSLNIESRITPEARQPACSNWMDQIALTMGLEGVRITLVEDD